MTLRIDKDYYELINGVSMLALRARGKALAIHERALSGTDEEEMPAVIEANGGPLSMEDALDQIYILSVKHLRKLNRLGREQ